MAQRRWCLVSNCFRKCLASSEKDISAMPHAIASEVYANLKDAWENSARQFTYLPLKALFKAQSLSEITLLLVIHINELASPCLM